MIGKELTDNQIGNLADPELKKYFRKATKSGLMGVTVVVIAVVIGMERGQFTFINLLWAFLMLMGCAFRWYHATKLFPQKDDSKTSIKQWQIQLHLYATYSGILWVALPILNPEIMTNITGAYTVILLGILTGGVYSLNRFFWAYILYSLPIGTFMVWFHANSGYLEGKILAGLICAFILAALSYARNTQIVYKDSYDLRNKNFELIEKLEKQAADLKVQKNKAEFANEEKSKFLAAASHDLRQPLHALGFYLSALNKHVKKGKGEEIIGKSEKSLDSLNDLLNALIGISQLDAGDIDISPMHFQLGNAIDPLIEEMQIAANQKDIKIDADTNNETAFCDQILLNRSIRNIILNAIKHAECSKISIKTEVTGKTDDLICITISDNGKGIPEDQLDAIFEEFHQIDNEGKDRRKGLGLGLAIVKRIAELQGHTITASSSDKGASFQLTLPRGNESFIVKINNKQSVSDIDKVNNILFIDDETDVLDSVALTLHYHFRLQPCRQRNRR